MSQKSWVVRQLTDTEWQSNEFGEKWNALLSSSVKPSIFSTWDWAVTWWSHYGKRKESHIVGVFNEAGSLIGIAPFYTQNAYTLGIFPYRDLHFIGDKEVGSEYLGFIITPGLESEVTQRVLEHLRKFDNPPEIYRFSGLQYDSPADAALIDFIGSLEGIKCERIEECNSIRLPANYQEYLGGLSKKFRQNIKTNYNKVLKELEVNLIITNTDDQLRSGLEQLFVLNRKRWGKRNLPGSFSNPVKCSFYKDVSQRFLRQGWLLFFCLELSGVIRACRYGVRYGGTYYALQTAFDIEFDKRYKGLGVLINAMSIEHCIKEGLTSFDFLGGSEDYKTRWGTKPHTSTTLTFYSRRPRSLLAYVCGENVAKLKKYLKNRFFTEGMDLDVVRFQLALATRKAVERIGKWSGF